MCTAIAKRGNDLIYGFNLDLDPAVWKYSLYRTKNYFTVGITVGKTTYFTHGVTKDGNFGNVPYMNGDYIPAPKGAKRERIDLMIDKFIRGKYSYADIEKIIETKTVTAIPAVVQHSLIGSGDGDFLIVEPGYGIEKADKDYAVLTNFPVLADLTDFSNPFYGKERYDYALSVLEKSGDDFSAEDALRLLYDVRQEGQWGTRVTFVYSRNEKAVYYFTDGNIEETEVYRF